MVAFKTILYIQIRKWFESTQRERIKMNMTVKEVEKECRDEARKYGLVFKKDKYLTINNHTAYLFADRFDGTVVISNCTIGLAYDNVCSGFIASYNKDTGQFSGVNHYI